MSDKIAMGAAKTASRVPVLEMFSVQMKGVPTMPALPVLFDLRMVKSGKFKFTVRLAWGEVTPPALAVAILVTNPAVTSPAVTV